MESSRAAPSPSKNLQPVYKVLDLITPENFSARINEVEALLQLEKQRLATLFLAQNNLDYLKGEIQKIQRPSLSYWQDAWIRLKKNRQAVLSLAIVASLILFTLLGPFLWRMDPSEHARSSL